MVLVSCHYIINYSLNLVIKFGAHDARVALGIFIAAR